MPLFKNLVGFNPGMLLATNREGIIFLLLALSLLLVTLPRFNRNDIGFIDRFTCGGLDCQTEDLSDAESYTQYVEYFRGNLADKETIAAPFAYRPLLPLLAAPLPFGAMTALNIVNLISLLAALYVLHRILSELDVPFRFRLGGLALFAFSFPVFFYGTVGVVDPLLLLLVTIGVYATIRKKRLLFAATLIIGSITKESIVILIPVYLAYQAVSGGSWRSAILGTIPLIALSTGALALARVWTPASDAAYQWVPSSEIFMDNFGRRELWLVAILTLGLPGLLTVLVFLRLSFADTREIAMENFHLVVGVVGSLALFFLAMMTAYADGRFLWVSYPFIIPLIMLGAKRYSESSGEETTLPQLS